MPQSSNKAREHGNFLVMQCSSGSFSHMVIYILCVENCQNYIWVHRCLPILGRLLYNVRKLHRPRTWECNLPIWVQRAEWLHLDSPTEVWKHQTSNNIFLVNITKNLSFIYKFLTLNAPFLCFVTKSIYALCVVLLNQNILIIVFFFFFFQVCQFVKKHN